MRHVDGVFTNRKAAEDRAREIVYELRSQRYSSGQYSVYCPSGCKVNVRVTAAKIGGYDREVNRCLFTIDLDGTEDELPDCEWEHDLIYIDPYYGDEELYEMEEDE